MSDSKFKYAYPGPPFNFLGHFSATQRDAFKEWVDARSDKFEDIALHHRIKAQQLRKSAGLLEQFYANFNDQKLAPTFSKETWKPSAYGHFNYAHEDDHVPMVVMSKIKVRFKEQLQRDEEAVFYMNQVRCLIEKHEDLAQYSKEFTDSNNPQNLKKLQSQIDSYFGQPEYEAVLVDDQNKLYKGQPYFRVNQADAPTQWELEQMNHSPADMPIAIKEQGDVEP